MYQLECVREIDGELSPSIMTVIVITSCYRFLANECLRAEFLFLSFLFWSYLQPEHFRDSLTYHLLSLRCEHHI